MAVFQITNEALLVSD